MASKVRYVARTVVERIEEHEGTGRGDDKRFKSTIANVTVGADGLDSLVQKAKAHLSLIEDGGEINV